MSRSTRRLIVPSFLLAMLLLPSLASAIDIWVTRYDDPEPGDCLPNDCSLREAVIAANGSAGTSHVYLSAGTYELTLEGVGEDGSLTGDLDLFNRSIVIRGAGANLTTIDANAIDRVFHFFGPELFALIQNLTIRGGSTPSSGAGIYLADGNLNVQSSEIRDNVAGMALVAWNGALAISDSTIAGNASGILLSGSEHGAVNLTYSGNGGALTVQHGSLLCQHCTLVDTESTTPVRILNDGLLQLRNSAILGGCFASGTGAIQTQDGNLESPGETCGLTLSEDQDNVAFPSLGVLQMNGGATRTHLPSAASPLLGGAYDPNCVELDQRGAGRPDVNCDTGAVERLHDTPPAATPLFIDGFEQGSPAAWSNY